MALFDPAVRRIGLWVMLGYGMLFMLTCAAWIGSAFLAIGMAI